MKIIVVYFSNGGFYALRKQYKINEIYISFEKLETLVSVLGKTLVEDFDFKPKDSLNMCSILEEEVKKAKMKFKDFETSVTSDKSLL